MGEVPTVPPELGVVGVVTGMAGTPTVCTAGLSSGLWHGSVSITSYKRKQDARHTVYMCRKTWANVNRLNSSIFCEYVLGSFINNFRLENR